MSLGEDIMTKEIAVVAGHSAQMDFMNVFYSVIGILPIGIS